MKIVNVITQYLWKTRETSLCLVLDVPEIDMVRLEHSIPRIKMNEKHGEVIGKVWHDSARLIVSVTNSQGVSAEIVASVNLNAAGGTMRDPASISVYESDVKPEMRIRLVGSKVELLRYEI
jgi:hypothetical protein